MFEREIAFAVSTFGESINPGPTLAALVAARTRSRREAWGVVFGVALANAAWVAVIISIGKGVLLIPSWPQLVPVLVALGAGVLIYIATRGLVGTLVSSLENFVTANVNSGPADATTSKTPSFRKGLTHGFVVHFVNPLSVSYYGGVYFVTVLNDPALAPAFAIIAIFIDLIVYSLIVGFTAPAIRFPPPVGLVLRRLFAFVAYFAMIFLVVQMLSRVPTPDGHAALPGLTTLTMLLGFLIGAIWEAEKFATRFGGFGNKLLWRSVLLWQSALGAIAIVGTFFSVVAALDPQSLGVDIYQKSAISVCALVAVVATATLSYARARGELLDEQKALSQISGKSIDSRVHLLNHPIFLFVFLVFWLVILLSFLVFFKFSIQDNL